ncbi:MAG: MBL fold metallo-hydrolase [Candidatus Hodarchaeales archaeon]|jgi:glyoxylase-like metal-dependent hydrolase (beta-lactamase superfamily II)
MKQILTNIYWLLGQGFDCNVFIIASGKETIMIDTGAGNTLTHSLGQGSSNIQTLKQAIDTRGIDRIFLTHGHIDHIGGILNLQSEVDCEILASHEESKHLTAANSPYLDPIMNSNCSPIKITKTLGEGDSIAVGDYNFKVFETPGHTKGSLSLFESNKNILISGDTVFPQGSFGRTDLPSGSSTELLKSLERLSKLEIKVLLPGHMPPIVSKTAIDSVKHSFRNAHSMLSYY